MALHQLLALLLVLVTGGGAHGRRLMQDVVRSAPADRAAEGAGLCSQGQVAAADRSRPTKHLGNALYALPSALQCTDLSTLMVELPEAADILQVIKGE